VVKLKLSFLINDKEILTIGQLDRESKVKIKKSNNKTKARKEEYHMKKSEYSALDIAKYIVDYTRDTGSEMTNLKLQKLLYFIEAKFMKENKGASLFYNELEAWDYGPVVEEVYSYYKGNVNRPISFNFSSKVEFTQEEEKTIKEVVDHFRDIDQWTMVKRTHEEGGPWVEYYKPEIKPIIPKKAVRNYYRNRDVLVEEQS